MYLLRKHRTAISTFRFFVIPLAAIFAFVTCPLDGQTAELLDNYFFTGENQGLTTGTKARITGQKGSFIELSSSGEFVNLISGTMTLVTGSQALTVRAGSHEISIPASTRVTIQNNGGLRVSTNDSSANGFVAISSGGSRMGNIAKGEAYPQGEPPLEPISTISALKKPLFCVGVGEMNLSGSSDDSVALLSGERFFCPSRSVKIGTPLGVVVAAPRTAFLVSVAPGRVRVFNCRIGSVKFHSQNKFRKISNAEEFCIFDHRPTSEEILPADGIGRKKITLHDLDNEKITASTNSFSVISLLTSTSFLGSWKRSSDVDRSVINNIIKSAAAYGGANPNAEEFYRTPAQAANNGDRQ